MYEKQMKLASLMQLLSTIPPRLETFKNLKPEMHKNVTKQMKYVCLINYPLLNKWWIVLIPRCPNYAKKILAILHSSKSAKHYLVWGKSVLTWCGVLWNPAKQNSAKSDDTAMKLGSNVPLGMWISIIWKKWRGHDILIFPL